jgi:hypothetical protein
MKHAKLCIALAAPSFALIWSSGAEGQVHADGKAITEADCSVSKMGDCTESYRDHGLLCRCRSYDGGRA